MGYKFVGDKIVYISPLAEAQAVEVTPAKNNLPKSRKKVKNNDKTGVSRQRFSPILAD